MFDFPTHGDNDKAYRSNEYTRNIMCISCPIILKQSVQLQKEVNIYGFEIERDGLITFLRVLCLSCSLEAKK